MARNKVSQRSTGRLEADAARGDTAAADELQSRAEGEDIEAAEALKIPTTQTTAQTSA